MATEIEAQTVRGISELVGYPTDAGGLMVSGGNMANFVCFLAARTAKAGTRLRTHGIAGDPRRFTIYASTETHTWLQKAADLFGFGTDSIRWIPVDPGHRMRVDALRQQIGADRRQGSTPFLVVANAGSVSTGAVDPLTEISALCRELDLWLH